MYKAIVSLNKFKIIGLSSLSDTSSSNPCFFQLSLGYSPEYAGAGCVGALRVCNAIFPSREERDQR